ncbi:MAG: hypothetical protein Q8J97_15610, partial [Flavobacteriaceae bacterium]|nr:hypothetical protein [Flavobacteriaceae bacterium]
STNHTLTSPCHLFFLPRLLALPLLESEQEAAEGGKKGSREAKPTLMSYLFFFFFFGKTERGSFLSLSLCRRVSLSPSLLPLLFSFVLLVFCFNSISQ